MATRFYVDGWNFTAQEYTPDAAWDITSAATYWRMYPRRSRFEVTTQTAGESTTTADRDVLISQFVSPPLTAQTITGTFHGVMMARESASGADNRSQCVVRVIAEDGTVRGTLISASTASLSNEWTASASAWRNARFPVGSSGASVTSVNAVAGDRIVVEVGFRAHNVSATSFTGTLRIGNGVTNTDLPSNDTQTTSTTDNPWFEFSQNLTFDVTEEEIFDDIADAVDALPDPLTEKTWREAAFDTFTTEADDPTEMLFGGNVTGWIRLDGPATGVALLKVSNPNGGHQSWPLLWVYDEVPTASSNEVGYIAYDDGEEFNLAIPSGEFRYIAIESDIGFVGGVFDLFFTIRRIDAGGATGDIKDDIVDAVDVFPASEGTETDSGVDYLSFFTTEADDPTEIATYTGYALGYTGWLKLVVPEDASVTISLVAPTADTDLMFWLYDEVPTASSVAVAMNDEGDPVITWWPYLPEMALTAGTYYLLVSPFEGSNWDPFGDAQITIRVRWELAPTVEDFSVDAIVLKTVSESLWLNTPTYIDAASGATDDAVTLSVALPGGLQENDLLLLLGSVDMEGSASTTLFTTLTQGGATFSGNTFTQLSTPVISPNSHRLVSAYHFWRGAGDTARLSTISSLSTAKAMAVMVFRGAGIPIVRGTTSSATVATGSKGTVSWFVNTDQVNYLYPILVVGAWAGGRAGSTTWAPSVGLSPPITERADVTATANASLMVATREVVADTFITAGAATPSAAEFNLNQNIHIVPSVNQLALSAFIGHGFFFDAFIQAAIHTTHPRTGPHTGTHLDTAVVTSALLGSLPAGTDLNTVLVDLDAMLTDLENQE